MSNNTNVLKTASDEFWFARGQHIASIWTTPESIRELSNVAFVAGARWQFQQSCQMSPHVARFIEMVTLLWGEDTYAALTTGLRAETSGRTTSGQGGDGDGELPEMPDTF